MALSNYEKQKRWRAKHRALYNLQQRNRRKKGGDATCREIGEIQTEQSLVSEAAPTVQSSGAATIAELRELVKQEEEKPITGVSSAPVGGIYRNDHGGVISKFAWEKLQRMKEDAKKGGYVLDEYSQT